jgi:hypothetical protein
MWAVVLSAGDPLPCEVTTIHRRIPTGSGHVVQSSGLTPPRTLQPY